MRITTKGEYALRALFDLVVALKDTHVIRIEDVAKRQNIPQFYLEQIFRNLRKAKIIASLKGPGGGYHLLKTANELSVREVLEAVGDKPLAKPKSQKASSREAKKVSKILDTVDEVIVAVLDRKLGDF
jgi:Rrf2 family transcriptional regulator, iron-sulfur cluster assembly transcription factor